MQSSANPNIYTGADGTLYEKLGNGDLKEMDAGAMDPSGRSTTNAGRICGMIATILMIVGAVAFAALFALGIMGGMSHAR